MLLVSSLKHSLWLYSIFTVCNNDFSPKKVEQITMKKKQGTKNLEPYVKGNNETSQPRNEEFNKNE
jgi:hypothetical protein